MTRKSKTYLRTRGLVQGDSLSSALCDVYLGHMVRKEIVNKLEFLKKGAGGESEKRLFVRAIDDFLFVSTDQDEVIRSVRNVHD
jgi:hypothetical protein